MNERLSSLKLALDARLQILEDTRIGGVRLFNGFLEGWPDLVVELLGSTLVIQDYRKEPEEDVTFFKEVASNYIEWLPKIKAVLLKQRNGKTPEARPGLIIAGDQPDIKINEYEVSYALPLMLNQDNGFYLDTRYLRAWLEENSESKSVLNTFAYTGSYGIAALAGGANRVVQADRNKIFLGVAEESRKLNGFEGERMKCRVEDFFATVAQFKKQGPLFDTVILDPPVFSRTEFGSVSLEEPIRRLVNKVRPLVADGGSLIVVNNGLFISGSDFERQLKELEEDGYLIFDEIIPVPEDCVGFPETITGAFPADPAPFNHSTKIAVIKVRRKKENLNKTS